MRIRAGIATSFVLLATVATGLARMVPSSAVVTITVNSTADTVANNGNCTLREAVQAANTNAKVDHCAKGSASTRDTIAFAHSLNGRTITLSGSIDVTSNMLINGNGRTKTKIAGGEFATGPGKSTIQHMTLVDVNNETGTVNVIDVKATSDMNNNTTNNETSAMHISRSTLQGLDNNSGFGTSQSTLTISKSTTGDINNNSGSGTTSHLTVTNSKVGEIDNNSGSSDGSVTTATIKNTTVKGRSGDTTINDNSDGTTVSILGTTITGGDLGLDNNAKSTRIVNSTITSTGTADVENNSGKTTIVNSTLTGSTNAVMQSGGTVTVTNSILASNSGPNCTGTVGSGGGNISDDASCAFNKQGDHNSKNPKIGALANNGGPTKTQLPAKGSPAIDHALKGPCPRTDQRGKKRPQDGDGNGTKVCDVGSVEVVP